jgi:hypothetical protein
MTQNGPYLTVTPGKVHRYWWTCFPALPRRRDAQAYHALKRVWFDHTINTFEEVSPGEWRRRARGFYTEGSEDHVAPVLFQNWALFPDTGWIGQLLERYQVQPQGPVHRVRWCPFFEQVYRGKKFCIADIVVCWKDDAGIGVLVLEAKVRGGKLGLKDHPATSPYLLMPSIRAVRRRYYGLLIDAADLLGAQAVIGDAAPIATWQTIARLQIVAAQSLRLPSAMVERITDSLAAHFSYFGIEADGVLRSRSSGAEEDRGTAHDYAEIRSHRLPACIEDYLIGSQVVFAARAGRMPEPPYAWLRDEPDCLSVYQRGKRNEPGYQTTDHRRVPRWHLDWRP